jgi:Lar family restriction alleviation protein
MTEELKGCPFCGGEAEFIGRTPFRPSASVVCMACDAAMFVEPKEEAIAAWNTRIAGQAELAWQDIATAPKDGTPFFALHRSPYRGESRTETVWWQPEFEAFISSCRELTMAPGYLIDGESRKLHSPDIFPATHWLCAIPEMPELTTAAPFKGGIA